MKDIAYILLCIVLAVFSLGAGWFAAKQSTAPAAHAHGHADGHAHGEAEKGHDHGHDQAEKTLSPQALRNMGVEVKEAATSDYVLTQPVAAVLQTATQSDVPVIAPVGGTVIEVKLLPGAVAQSGAVAVRIVRDPLPRPTLLLTEELIKPAAEQLHTTMAELKRAGKQVELLRTELKRVQEFTQPRNSSELPVLPRKTEIDLRNELTRAEQELENVLEKLTLHGMAKDDIARLEKGSEHLHFSADIWQRALRLNGLWPDVANDVFKALPGNLRETPWAVAAIGELSGAGLTTAALADWLKREPAAAAQFISVAGLLQQGSSLEQVQRLHASNALAAVVDVLVPAGAPDWDVLDVAVKPNARVEAGAVLATLRNARELLLSAEPVGSEVGLVLKAFEEGKTLSAEPLVEGTGPELKGLRILYVAGGEAQRSTPAVLRVKNEPLKGGGETADGSRYRSWSLRAGARYQLRVPKTEIKEVFVLPAEALTDDGPDKIVFVKNGETFEPRRVVVRHQDAKTVVLDSKHSDLFPGDDVVVQGAFALGLALKAGSGEADAHAGHTH